MATTAKQDEAFLAAIVSKRLLDDAIEWISDNLNPEDVFPEVHLANWAEANGYEKTE